jgi:hypothetical protein
MTGGEGELFEVSVRVFESVIRSNKSGLIPVALLAVCERGMMLFH